MASDSVSAPSIAPVPLLPWESYTLRELCAWGSDYRGEVGQVSRKNNISKDALISFFKIKKVDLPGAKGMPSMQEFMDEIEHRTNDSDQKQEHSPPTTHPVKDTSVDIEDNDHASANPVQTSSPMITTVPKKITSAETSSLLITTVDPEKLPCSHSCVCSANGKLYVPAYLKSHDETHILHSKCSDDCKYIKRKKLEQEQKESQARQDAAATSEVVKNVAPHIFHEQQPVAQLQANEALSEPLPEFVQGSFGTATGSSAQQNEGITLTITITPEQMVALYEASRNPRKRGAPSVPDASSHETQATKRFQSASARSAAAATSSGGSTYRKPASASSLAGSRASAAAAAASSNALRLPTSFHDVGQQQAVACVPTMMPMPPGMTIDEQSLYFDHQGHIMTGKEWKVAQIPADLNSPEGWLAFYRHHAQQKRRSAV